MEGCVGHAERLKDAFGEELFVGLAGGDFDDSSADVEAGAVFPFFAGLEAEGALGECIGGGFEGDVAFLLADEARGVGDEVANGEAVDGLAALVFASAKAGINFSTGSS